MTTRPDPVTTLEALVACDPGSMTLTEVIRATQHIKSVRGCLDGIEARLGTRSRELDAPVADLFSRNAGVSAAEGRLRDRRSKALEDAPSFVDALAHGSVSAGHADALANATGRLDDATRSSFFDREDELLDRATHSTPEQFGRHCRDLVDRLARDEGVERAERQRRNTSLRRSIDPATGMYRISGELHPELGARVFTALDLEVASLVAAAANRGDGPGADRGVDRNLLAAEALGNLIGAGHQATRPADVEITVLVDHHTLQHGLHQHSVCEFSDGTPIPPVTARRLACNARILPTVLNGAGVPIDVGRERRLATRAQRRALRAMYRTCAFAGCDTTFNRCEIHHLIEWDDLGDTDLRNLLPLCSHHHHLVHEGGWHLDLDPGDRTLTMSDTTGEIWATCGVQLPTPCTDGCQDERHPRCRTRHRSTNDQSVTAAPTA